MQIKINFLYYSTFVSLNHLTFTCFGKTSTDNPHSMKKQRRGITKSF